MKMYFSTTANGRKWNKSRWGHFYWAYFDDVHVHLREGERTLQLFTAVRFVHKAYYIANVQLQK